MIVGDAGWRLYEYGIAGSTNDLARDLPAWSAVRAETQTGGRGRFGRVFVSDPGGLWISAVLPAEGGTQRWAGFSLMVGIHLVRMMEALNVPGARLRWPNDLMSGTKKLGGLLIEQSARETLIVGFGLNVRNAPWKTDPALGAIATSLERACGAEANTQGGTPESCNIPALSSTGGTGVPPVCGATLPMPSAPTGGTPVPPVPKAVSGVFEIAVRTLDALAAAHQEMQEAGLAGAIRELNRHWEKPVPVRIALAGGTHADGRFTGLDPHGNLRMLDESGREFFIPHQSVEKLLESG